MNAKCAATTRKKTNCTRDACDNSEFCKQHQKMIELITPLKSQLQNSNILIQNTFQNPPQSHDKSDSLTSSNIDNCYICNKKFDVNMDPNDKILKTSSGAYYHESCSKNVNNSNSNNNNNSNSNISECCCCLEELEFVPIVCKHIICKTCFKQLRTPFCPICRSPLESLDKSASKSIAKMTRRMKDDKERNNTRLTQQLLREEQQRADQERIIDEQWTEACSYAIEIILGLSDLRKEDIALACFRIMRHRFEEYDVNLLTAAIDNSFIMLNI